MNTITTPSTTVSRQLDEFFARVREPTSAGRLIFALDATASREPTWDTAARLTAEMFSAAPSVNAQLVYFRGHNECVASRWFSDPKSLTTAMTGIVCRAGETQIGKVLAHARRENVRLKVDALVLISDSCEERATDLYASARELTVPCFLFQEGDRQDIAEIYREIAAITKGAYARFDSNAAARLKDLLKAVAAFAVGGLQALAKQNTDAARPRCYRTSHRHLW
jgi:hypothetical protein